MRLWLKPIKKLHQKSFVNSSVLGGTQDNCVPIKMDVLPELIKKTYNTVHSLEKSDSDEE